jgi:putative ABC transport system permease protein
VTVLGRKLAREIYASKGLLLLIASIIGVGVTCFVSLQSAYHNLDQAKRWYYGQCRMADFWIELKKVPVSEIEVLREVPGVSKIEARIKFLATVDLEDTVEPINGLVLSLPDRRASVINDIVMRQGDYFSRRRANEVIVSEKFARTHNLYPGSRVHLLLNNRRQELFVVGTATSSEFTYLLGPGSLVPDPEHFGVFYVKHSFAEEVFDFEGATNQIVGRLAVGAEVRLEEIMNRVEELLDDYGVFTTTPLELQESNQFLSNEIAGLGAIATVIPAIFLAVAALVLNILVNRMARRQRTVVGTLKALGYRDRQIFAHFLTYGLVVGLFGGLVGSVLGYLASAGLTYVYGFFFEFPELRSGFYWYTHGIGVTASLLCAVIGSYHGARVMLRLRPAEAMRPEPPRRGGSIWLERWLGGIWGRLSVIWRMALRGLFRHRVRSATSIFAATMGAGLLVTGFMMTEAQNFLLDFQFYRLARSDIDLSFEGERGIDAFHEVRRLPAVDHAEPVLQVACTFVQGPYRRKGGVMGVARNARLTVPYDVHVRRVPIPESGLVLTRRLADTLHVAPGDKVTIVPVKGERRPVDVVVSRIADSYLGLVAYADLEHLSHLVGETFVVTGAQIVTDTRPERLAELYRELKRTPGIESVQARRDMIENLTETLLINQYVSIGVLIAFSGVIFLGSIVNASMVSLAERQREVATFRALGYSPWQIGAVFLRESLVTTLFGTLLGLPAGYFLTWLTATAYENDLVRLPVVSAPWVWITTLISAVLFVLLAHAVVQWNIFRMDCLEALKVKE